MNSSWAEDTRDDARYIAWFHDLDAWTEYWDIYHPETCGRFYFGDGNAEEGLLTKFLPRESHPAAFSAWTRFALGTGSYNEFTKEIRVPGVASAVLEVESLVARLFTKHFGNPLHVDVQKDYLKSAFRIGIDTLPPATERDARIPANDWRKPTAGRHMIAGDIMWFAWAVHLEGVHALLGEDEGHSRRTLQLAGIAVGCAANFVWRGHRRTRPEYQKDDATIALLEERGVRWALDYAAVTQEIHELYRIREWGHV